MKRNLALKKKQPEERDAKKFGKLYFKLRKISEQKHLAEVKALSQVGKPRETAKAPPTVPAAPTTKVTVNVSGNLRGMHLAGNSEEMRRRRAMRQFYNKQMPVLSCSTCAFSSTCPQFKAGYQCAYLPFLDSHRIESEQDLIQAMQTVAGASVRRMHLATLMETLSGGAPSLETTEALALTFQQLAKLHEISAQQTSVTVETNDSGIIGRIFNGLESLVESTRQAHQTPIEVPPIFSQEPKVAALEDHSSEVDEELIRAHSKDELARATGKGTQAMAEISISSLKTA